jgi:hypothetical protein
MGWMAVSEDYSKVMSKLDLLVFGKPKPQEGGPSYDQVMDVVGKTKRKGDLIRMPVLERQELAKWPFYKHVNPADWIFHGINELVDKLSKHKESLRYPGGLHWTLDEPKFRSYHLDSWDPIYLLNNLNHGMYEGFFYNYKPQFWDFVYDWYRSGYHYVYW